MTFKTNLTLLMAVSVMGCVSSKRSHKRELASFNGICSPLTELIKDAELDFAHSKGEFVKGNDTGLFRILSYYMPKIQLPGFDPGMICRSDSGSDHFLVFKELEPGIYTDAIYSDLVSQLDFCFRDLTPLKNATAGIHKTQTNWVLIPNKDKTYIKTKAELALEFYPRIQLKRSDPKSFYVLSLFIRTES
jgi:hypothetical protein